MEEIDLYAIVKIAEQAGKEILRVYEKDFSVEYKKSNYPDEQKSPITEADRRANEVIINRLKELYPSIPILSEESKEVPYEERKLWKLFWLIDPLDGTKEFINRNGEFTVNIALINDNKPVLGVVGVPVKRVIYYADENGSFKQVNGSKEKLEFKEKNDKDKLIVVASRSHLSEETKKFVEEKKKEYKEVELISAGSSLKFCLVAEGKADIYPRLGPTMEWDTAAAHAVVNGAGRKVYKYGTEEELEYNKKDLLNPWFIVK